MLPRYADALKGVGVTSVTVTVNAVDSNVLKDIISAVTYDGTVYGGVRGAEILIRNQLDGIRLASKFAVVKVNTVLIPGVNDSHIGDIAKAAALAGANMYNIIPLIPQGEFQNTPPPDCRMLAEARETAEEYLPVFKHCKRCRADACGIPGVSEYAPSLYKNATETFSHG
jgi:nitrogen fixation protein NifB